jgi:hypothetical protein
MVTIAIGAGVDVNGNVVDLYVGSDFSAAKSAVDAAGTGGQILEGYVFLNPPPKTTLRYGPGI